MKHTPTPWHISEDGPHIIDAPTLKGLAGACGAMFKGEDEPNEEDVANAERIVTCVNAFDGIENPQHYIDEMKKLHKEYIHEAIELRSENKRLREQIDQFEKLAHDIVSKHCNLEVTPGLRRQINDIIGIKVGGAK